jgi:hypothetical protein
MNVRRQTLTLLVTGGLATSLGACKSDDSGDDGGASASETDPGSTSAASNTMSSTSPTTTMTTEDPTETDPTVDPTETDPTDPTVDPDTSTGEPGAVDAFRFTSLYIRDPHFFVSALGFCIDVTDTDPPGQQSLNNQFNDAIGMDDPASPDGNLDLSLMLLFRPLDQADGASGSADFANGSCAIPAENTVCDIREGTALDPTEYTSLAVGTCLMPDESHLSTEDYNPAPGTTGGPCFHAGPATVHIQTSFSLELETAEIAGQFDGDPADGFLSGTLRGFLSEATANTTMLPADLQDSTGATFVSELIPGGMNSCAGHDDRDGAGWWFYADFTAERVPWNGD